MRILTLLTALSLLLRAPQTQEAFATTEHTPIQRAEELALGMAELAPAEYIRIRTLHPVTRYLQLVTRPTGRARTTLLLPVSHITTWRAQTQTRDLVIPAMSRKI